MSIGCPLLNRFWAVTAIYRILFGHSFWIYADLTLLLFGRYGIFGCPHFSALGRSYGGVIDEPTGLNFWNNSELSTIILELNSDLLKTRLESST